MNRKILAILVAALPWTATFAENAATDSVLLAAVQDTVTVIPADFDEELDEIVHNWYLQNVKMGECNKDTGMNLATNEEYIARLQKLPYIMEMPYNDIVKKFIEHYLQRPDKVGYMLGLGETYYFPIFENALERYGVPLELKYLPVIESALNARATSRAGAAGLWQFMVPTGRLYGLEVNSLVDERRDPLKSSDAAARYLRDLYNIYRDWHLVIAAYNCGPGNVAKATRYAGGGKKDYWQIYPYLPRETRSYVPIFIAANYVMNYYDQHNICPVEPTVTVATDTIMVDKRINLQQVSDILSIPMEELRFMNPQYRQDLIPGNIKPYPLVLPLNHVGDYIANSDTIPLHRAAELVANRAEVKPAAYNPSGDGRLIYYKVRSGDTLGGIAARYHCTVNQIKRWNGLRGSMIRIGQRLKIYR